MKPDLKETTILFKGEGLAVIGFHLTGEAGVVFNANMRDETQSTQTFMTAKETWAKFEEAIVASQARGWKVAHRGLPNYG